MMTSDIQWSQVKCPVCRMPSKIFGPCFGKITEIKCPIILIEIGYKAYIFVNCGHFISEEGFNSIQDKLPNQQVPTFEQQEIIRLENELIKNRFKINKLNEKCVNLEKKCKTHLIIKENVIQQIKKKEKFLTLLQKKIEKYIFIQKIFTYYLFCNK
jgi:hypothetical protein